MATHNRLDQRFGVLAAKLKTATSLETPEQYQSFVQENYKPARGLRLIVELVHGAHDWRALFKPIEARFTGLFGVGGGTADAGHCFRVIRADELANLDIPEKAIERESPAFQGMPSAGSDAVLLAKHWMSSRALSQAPLLLLPSHAVASLDWQSLQTAQRNELLPRAASEYQKTACSVAAEPWRLLRASAYLLDWVDRNTRGDLGKPPLLHFVAMGPHEFGPEAVVSEPTWVDFALDAPRKVAVVAKLPRRRVVGKTRPEEKARPPAAVASHGGAEDQQDAPLPLPVTSWRAASQPRQRGVGQWRRWCGS